MRKRRVRTVHVRALVNPEIIVLSSIPQPLGAERTEDAASSTNLGPRDSQVGHQEAEIGLHTLNRNKF